MKKFIFFSAALLLFTAANAEQMQFVTTMSAPVGNFAHLDAADSTHVTTAPILNFCNTRSSVGDIIIKGASAYLNQVNIQNGTTLGSTNTPEYRLGENLSIENGGTVTAGRLMANDVTFKDTNFHKSNVTNTIYTNDVAVMGGKTDNMEIASTAKITKGAQNSANLGEELWWDNQYAGDYDASGNKKANGKTYTSFLLKSKTATTPDSYKFKAVIKDVQAAKLCGTRSISEIQCYGKKDVDYRESRAHYVYADRIKQEPNVQFQNCGNEYGQCGWMIKIKKWSGDISMTKTSYLNPYNGVEACPTASSDDQICADNCDSTSFTCSFACVKKAAKLEGCGPELLKRDCFCPCSTTKGSYACQMSHYNTLGCPSPAGTTCGNICERAAYEYEPLLGGTGQILTCVVPTAKLPFLPEIWVE